MNTRSMTGGMCRASCEKDRITAEAERLCALLGPGWTPDVWLNNGWQYCASYKNLVYVHAFGRGGGKYFCMLGRGGCMLANLAPEHVQGRDPRNVVERALAGYREKWLAFKAEQEELLAAADECLKGESEK